MATRNKERTWDRCSLKIQAEAVEKLSSTRNNLALAAAGQTLRRIQEIATECKNSEPDIERVAEILADIVMGGTAEGS